MHGLASAPNNSGSLRSGGAARRIALTGRCRGRRLRATASGPAAAFGACSIAGVPLHAQGEGLSHYFQRWGSPTERLAASPAGVVGLPMPAMRAQAVYRQARDWDAPPEHQITSAIRRCICLKMAAPSTRAHRLAAAA